MDAEKIQRRRLVRMAKIYKERGRNRSVANMAITKNDKGQRIMVLYGPKQIHS